MISAKDSVLGLLLALALVSGPLACADSEINVPDPPQLTSVEVTPVDPELQVTLEGGQSLEFVATGVDQKGQKQALSGVQWSVTQGALGTISAEGVFVASGVGGVTTVTATYKELSGSSEVQILLQDTVAADGISQADLDRLAAAQPQQDLTNAPSLLYPEDETMIPVNLPPMSFQWSGGEAENDLFALQITAPHVNVMAVTDKLQWEFTLGQWYSLLTSAGADPLSLTLLGGARQSGPVYQSSSQTLSISSTPISGQIYYWATGREDSGTSGIVTVYAGSRDTVEYYTQNTNGTGRCAGCHALSRDGRKILFTEYNDPGGDWSDYIKGLDVVDQNAFLPPDNLLGDFFTFSPDGERFVSSETGVLTLRRSSDGAALSVQGDWQGQLASHPDWSPVSDQLAIVLFPDGGFSDYHFCQGSVAVTQVTTEGTWTAQTIVASSGPEDNNYYPAFSPDGQYLVFNKAGADSNTDLGDSPCDMYANPGATLHMVAASGGQPLALGRANQTGKLTNSWPKWAPANQGDTIWWLAFSSTRDYGHTLINSTQPDSKGSKLPQVWITAIDVAKLAQGDDPSYPAFWMPGQLTTSGNHLPFWTQRIE